MPLTYECGFRREDDSYLIIMILGRIDDRDVTSVQRLSRLFETVVDLMCDRQPSRTWGCRLDYPFTRELGSVNSPAPTTTTLNLSLPPEFVLVYLASTGDTLIILRVANMIRDDD